MSEELHPLQAKIISAGLENVQSLKKQLTSAQCEELLKEFCDDKKLIWNTLLEMENKADLKKKYVSVYLTLRNWIKLKIDSGKVANPCAEISAKSGLIYTYKTALTWVQKHSGSMEELDTFFDFHGTDEKTGAKLYTKRTDFKLSK